MSILLWLAPAAVITCVAMAWAAWAGRGRPPLHERSDAAQARAQQRFADALTRPLPDQQAVRRPIQPSTGVALRRPGRH